MSGQAQRNHPGHVATLTKLLSLEFLLNLTLVTQSDGEADSPPSTRIERGETCVRVTFCPTLQDQSTFSSSGIMADFVVQYDVVMEDIIGDVQIYDGYFIHYFAPRGLPPVEKNVVFVIDVSGSMFGTKMKQCTVKLI
ncbi:hypothetical protein HJG60_012246 [Phyllostomus discolor]|uniref:Inter-alpha-trypsin inhibitor heavy chain H6-like n=1 Tax=Phyllostomus discolor TaxID=89673 RepID=A0A834DRL3_9CHIR|nr:hypothetical protein HJG60_012246 [Phyllostomus discolor]